MLFLALIWYNYTVFRAEIATFQADLRRITAKTSPLDPLTAF